MILAANSTFKIRIEVDGYITSVGFQRFQNGLLFSYNSVDMHFSEVTFSFEIFFLECYFQPLQVLQ